MGVIKGIKWLSGLLDETQISKLEAGAQLYLRHSRIEFKVLSADEGELLVQAKQGKSAAENYLSQKDLISRTKDFFDSVGVWRKINVHATPYQAPPVDIVTAEWIRLKMLEHSVQLKKLVADTGIDKTSLSSLINEHVNLSQPVKAMFYYYFKALSSGL